VVLHLGDWRIPAPNTGPVLLTAAEAGSTDTWLGLLADGPRIEILGAITAPLQSGCQVGDEHLACLTVNDQLRILRYRP
jgi:hypothetical protein